MRNGEKVKRILVISYAYPPANSVASQRISKFTKYLYQWGWEPHVITISSRKSLLNDLPYEIPKKLIHVTKKLDFDRISAYIYRRGEILGTSQASPKVDLNFARRILEFVRETGQKIIIPDGKIGWYPYVLDKGREIIPEIKPSVILASGGPYTGLMAAARLSKMFNLSWVADLRDLWADNHTVKKLFPFSIINESLERRTLSSASKIITVSEPLADILRNKYGNSRVEVVYNGYEEDDFITAYKAKSVLKRNKADFRKLRISYFGMLYRHQNPKSLFMALKKIKDGKGSVPIELHFYGPEYPGSFFDLVTKFNVRDIVFYHGQVPYQKSLSAQVDSDLLLLLLWDEERVKGILTGKLFEYIAANRAILAVGPETDSAGEFVKKYKLGFVNNDPDKIKQYLTKKLIEKKENGEVKQCSMNSYVREFFTRKKQTEILARILEEVIQV